MENDSALDWERSADAGLMAVNGSEPADDFFDAERFCPAIHCWKRDCNGAGSRIRTDDLLITNQLLYQLSYAGFYEGKYSLTRLRRVPFYTPFLYDKVWRL